MHPTNPIERLTGENKRRADDDGIFPDNAAIVGSAGALLLERNGEWTVQRADYMSLQTMAPCSDDPMISLPVGAC